MTYLNLRVKKCILIELEVWNLFATNETSMLQLVGTFGRSFRSLDESQFRNVCISSNFFLRFFIPFFLSKSFTVGLGKVGPDGSLFFFLIYSSKAKRYIKFRKIRENANCHKLRLLILFNQHSASDGKSTSKNEWEYSYIHIYVYIFIVNLGLISLII